MNLTTVDDPIQRKFLPSFLRGVAEENKLVTSPNFVVTQALVALLADKGARLRPVYDKADMEKRGLSTNRMSELVSTLQDAGTLWNQNVPDRTVPILVIRSFPRGTYLAHNSQQCDGKTKHTTTPFFKRRCEEAAV